MTVSELQKVMSEYPPDAEVKLTARFDDKRRMNDVRMVVGRDEDPLMTWTLYCGHTESLRGERSKLITFIE